MIKNARPCILIFVILTVITGIVYPAAVTAVSELLMNNNANGSLIDQGSETRGSFLIGQEFDSPAYFWGRPSATGYSTLPSSGSNQGPTSRLLKKQVDERRARLAHFIDGSIPADLLLSSGSGLDPHISPEAAFAQIDHVSKARFLTPGQRKSLAELVRKHVEAPQYGIFGAPRVNVMKLNMDVNAMFGNPRG